MHHRSLGRTGLRVSPLCLGAMMFGAWGNPDHDESVAVIHAALDAGINFIDTADVYSAGESEEIVGKAIAGAPRRGRPGHQVLRARWATNPTRAAARATGSCASARRACAGSAPTTSTSTRCTGPTRTSTSTRRSARCPTSSTRARSATSAAPPTRRRPSSRPSGWPSAASASGSCASSRRTRSSCAASRPTCCRPASATAWA